MTEPSASRITTDGRSAVSEDPTGAAFPWKPKPVSELLGGELVLDADTKGAKVPVADLASKHLLLYFSAHWCPPCRGFTPKLAEAYKAYKEKGLDLELIFVSSDRDEKSFAEYFGEMPWLALPYADRDRKSALSKAFDVEGIPTLVVLGPVDAATGEREVVNKNARGAVGGDPTGADFPRAPKPIADLATTTECNGSDINETPSLVVFVEGCNDDAQAEAVKAMETVAAEVAAAGKSCEDGPAAMKETEAFLANLASQCALKKKEWAERQKMRAEEISAISEAIKVLNDDDALDLFKKTLSLTQTSSQMGFIQKTSQSTNVLRARRMVSALMKKGSPHRAEFALIEMSMKSRAVDFSKIMAMIDGMAKVLGEEQKDDDATKSYCDKELTKSLQDKKDSEEAIATSEAAIEEMTDESATLADEIKRLGKEVKALDKAVAEATEQRKEEHGEFITFQTENNAALQLIEKARNKLFKFYRPNQYKEAPVKELTEEEKILAASGRSDMIATAAPELIAGTTQTAMTQLYAQLHQHTAAAPPPPPATWDAYQKKDGKSNGVIALMDMLLKELQDGIVEAV